MPARFRSLFGCALFSIVLLCDGSLIAQNSGLDLSLHANDKATPADIGLPSYPGATLYKQPDNDATFNLGFKFGDSQFRLMGANYFTADSPEQVLSFYRKPLSRYGDVLECKDGKPVGKLSQTSGGLTCSDKKDGHLQVNGYSDTNDHELRVGNPHEFRVVGIDKSQPKATHFAMVYVLLPKDADSKSN